MGILDTGALSLDSTSQVTWKFNVAASPPGTVGTDFDQLNVVGSVALGGLLNVTGLTPLLTPAAGV